MSSITNRIPAHEYTSVDEGFQKWREEAALEWRLSTESRALHSSADSPALLKVVFSYSLNPPASLPSFGTVSLLFLLPWLLDLLFRLYV